ncbi:hypothetical protein [Henriciella sp.]|uniref:hypothetical protein n=1 Tax=Henriciella sp. TaxID=1968823 RepID=UPI002627ACB7|nr:hypothetical protein [Henriciella sp.]
MDRYANADYVHLEDIMRQDIDLYRNLFGFPNEIFANGNTWRNYRRDRSAGHISDYGTLTRSGGGHVDRYNGPDGTAYREVYPLIPRSVEMAGTEPPQDVYYMRVLTDPEYKGFGFCNSGFRKLDNLATPLPASVTPTGEPWPPGDPDPRSKHYVVRIGETEIFGDPDTGALIGQVGFYFVARDGRLFFRDL